MFIATGLIKKFKWRSLIPALAVMSGVNIDSKMNPYTSNGINGVSPIYTYSHTK